MGNSTEAVIYFGVGNEFTVANLQAFTSYMFSLEACNQIGCSRSSIVAFSTSEMVPLSVSLPTLVSIDSTSMILKWNKPSSEQLANGILIKNILYVSHMNASITVYVYDCCTTVQVLDNLVPGTRYAIILSACTNGGCTNSSTLEVSTLEILPNVADLTLQVFKKNSTFISIRWNDPTQPNGKIIKYILYMNGIVVFTGNYRFNDLNCFFFSR